MVVNVGHQLFHNLINGHDYDDTPEIAYTCMQLATLTSYDVAKNIILYHVPSDIVISDYSIDVNEKSVKFRISITDSYVDVSNCYDNLSHNHVTVILTNNGTSSVIELSKDNEQLFSLICENISAAHGHVSDIRTWAHVCITNKLIFQSYQNRQYLNNIEHVIAGDDVLDYHVSEISENSVTFSSESDHVHATITVNGDVVLVNIRIHDDRYDLVMNDNDSLTCAKDVLVRAYVGTSVS